MGRFQFTPLHERQRGSRACRKMPSYFNSRLYMRGSLLANKLIQRSSNFNSRLYMRGSLSQGTLSQSPPIFQFTPLHERQPLRRASRHIDALFQFTPLHERQQYDQLLERLEIKFQFTPLHERQPGGSAATAGRKDFNSRLYMRGSTECPQTGITACNFNSRLYMRGSPAIQPRISILSLFQFTPLHERQLGETVGKRKKSIISIHAST